jgi:ubiquinone/menaquinone biosynthesis C-methylase UbiE
MGFYDTHILPRLIDVAMNTAAIRDERQRCLEGVTGTVLEVGFGSGRNLPYYPADVTKVVGVDPSSTAASLARTRVARATFPVEILGLSAERIPVADASVDGVVTTFTLCTIPEPRLALAEMRRVLRPGGRLHFVEHGLAPDPRVRRWQHRLNRLQRTVFGGCNLDRPIADLITGAGFTIERLENAYVKGAPKFAGYLYRGVAK